ncbi:hypothetical protein COV82_03145 [Candidatus Peregrinibacteria bacterium CG11_big_fil_rev_8_21_14_0_20_46_8]|nr:MAG: hypothetical protein COV82_03145 [Candidatus Peregrinibacteria bacterium CG11_big_fil_rev_8_21_14_0_20_46_8]
MKLLFRFSVSTFLLAGLLGLSGCEILPELRAKILGRGGNAVNVVKEKADAVTEQYERTKGSVTERIDEVRDAAREVKEAATEVKEAVDAVDKIGKDEEASVKEDESANENKSEAPNLEDSE